MPTYTYSIETSDDGLPNETPWKAWVTADTGTEDSDDWASTYGSLVLANYLCEERPEGGWARSGLDVRIVVWKGPVTDVIGLAAAVVCA